MPTRSHNKPGKEDRFSYRTSIVRGRKIRQRALDLSVAFEDIIDRAVDRYFRDVKTLSLEQPRTNLEADYCRRVLKILRDRKNRDAACHKEMLDLILRNYE